MENRKSTQIDLDTLLAPGCDFEKYTVVRRLAHGGMGAVYLVTHRLLNTSFAMKVLFPEIAARDEQFVKRFIREAQLACQLHHPNLITVHDAGENNGIYFIIMDYISGDSLRKRLKAKRQIAPLNALDIIRQVAMALDAAATVHLVHRDIKPENIMFTADEVVKLADLGIAKVVDNQDSMITMEGASGFGTPAYMSPEQALDPKKVDSRADIYSLGITLFEMLSGSHPYPGDNDLQFLSKLMTDSDIPDIRTISPEIPEAIAQLVSDMTHKKLSQRIASPAELIQRIDAAKLQSEPFISNWTTTPVDGGVLSRGAVGRHCNQRWHGWPRDIGRHCS